MREREDWSQWRTAVARSGGFGGEVEWAGDRWRPDQLSVVVARLVVKIGIELGALGDEIDGSI